MEASEEKNTCWVCLVDWAFETCSACLAGWVFDTSSVVAPWNLFEDSASEVSEAQASVTGAPE